MPKASGVYAIINRVTGNLYIGSAVSIEKRFYGHRLSLMASKHRSIVLQRAWDKHGAEAFEFRTLLRCAPKDCIFYEQRCIDSYQPQYNICQIAGSRLGTKYTDEARIRLAALRKAAPRSEKQLQHIANLAAAKTGKPGYKPTDEVRAKIAATLSGRKQSAELIEKRIAPLRGKTRPDEVKAQISASKIGKKRDTFSDEWRAKIGAAHKGRKHTPEAIARMSQAKKESWARRKTKPDP